VTKKGGKWKGRGVEVKGNEKHAAPLHKPLLTAIFEAKPVYPAVFLILSQFKSPLSQAPTHDMPKLFQGAYKFGKMKFPEFSRFSRPFE